MYFVKEKLFLLMALFVSTTMAWADGTNDCGDGVTWTLENNVLTLSKTGDGGGNMTNFSKPEDRPWHDSSESITSVVIGSNVIRVGDLAFWGCTNLSSVQISGVYTIGKGAFIGCSSLTAIDIPYGLNSIGETAFYGCGLTSITLPSSLRSVGSTAFARCENLVTVTFKNGLLSGYGENVFAECTALTTINVPIDDYKAFSNAWSDLTPKMRGEGHSGESTVTLCNGHLTITYGRMADYNTTNNQAPWSGLATSVVINNGVVEIGENAFYNCAGLTSIEVPNGVEKIGAGAFKGCTGLASVTLYRVEPPTLSAGEFDDCADGLTINVPLRGHYTYKETDNWSAYAAKIRSTSTSGDCTVTLQDGALTVSGEGAMADYYSTDAPWGNTITSLVVNDGVTYIGAYAFYETASLTSATIAESVTGVGKYAFRDCAWANSMSGVVYVGSVAYIQNGDIDGGAVVIREGTKSIAPNAFYTRSQLTSITLPEGLTDIGENAFFGTNLTGITIPSSVTYIGEKAFHACLFQKTSFVNNSALDAETNGYWGAQVFDEYVNGLYINDHVVITANSSITATTIPDDVTTIGAGAFYRCNNLSSVTIGSGVETIGGTAFYYCSNLTTVTMGSSVKTIGDYAFYSCPKLTAITLPNAVKTIGEQAFYACTKLTTVNIGSGLESIGPEAFYECNKLSSINIPENVKTIGYNAFINCDELESVTIPAATLGSQVFGYCDKLSSVTIGSSVTSIGMHAFWHCQNLASVTINAPSLVSYEEKVFHDNHANLVINVPAGSLDDYAAGWSDNASKLRATLPTNNVASGDFAGYWSTYYNNGCNVSVDDDTHIYYISAVDGTTATLTENTTDKVISAGQAVLLKSTAADVAMTYSADASAHDYTGNQLAGVDAATTTADYTSAHPEAQVFYTLANNSGLGFYKYIGENLAANKAFIALNVEVANARAFLFCLDETNSLTPITIPEQGSPTRSLSLKGEGRGYYYNLRGQRVEQPTKKGLYIRNGKKVVVTKR